MSRRRLYDAGAAVAHSPSLLPLVPAAEARISPYELDNLGVAAGDRVRVRSARGAVEVTARADHTVPRGVLAVDFNVPVPGPDGAWGPGAAALVDTTGPVTEVRLESVG